jgi:hypothetical protein
MPVAQMKGDLLKRNTPFGFELVILGWVPVKLHVGNVCLLGIYVKP